MALEHYVSAEWVEDPVLGTRSIKATGDDGSIWWIPGLLCDVPPWPEFLETEVGQAFKAASPQPKEAP